MTNPTSRYWIALPGLELVVARYGDNHHFAPHFHRGFSVGVQDSGTVHFQHARSVGEMDTNGVMMVNPREVHSAHTRGAGPWTTRSFYIEAAAIPELCGLGPEASEWTFREASAVDPTTSASLVALHRDLEADTEAEPEARVRSVLGGLFRTYARPAPRQTPVREAVLQAQEYLRRDLTQTPSLSQIGGHVGLSPFHFLRVFKAHTGMTPHAWLMQERVERSIDMLQDGQPIAETSRRCGFADQSHLTRRFKQVLGVPPGTFVRGTRS